MPDMNFQYSVPQNNAINDSREVTVEIVTPVHVGASSEKLMRKGTDYFYMDSNLYFIDFNKLLKAVLAKGVRMDTVSNMLADGKVNDLQTYLFKTLKIDIEDLSYNTIEDFGKDPGGEIRPLIRNGAGSPYIPGSSIKGALRSVIFNQLYTTQNTQGVPQNKLEDDLLGRFDQSIMRFIRVYDAHFEFSDTGTYTIDLFNLYQYGREWESNWKKGFNIVAECFYPESTTNFRLSLAKPLADLIANKYNRPERLPRNINKVLPTNPFDHLHKMVNDYTRQHIDKEIEFLQKYDQANDADLMIENLQDLKRHTEGADSCLLRMAYGSGFYGVTGDWRFKNHLETINKPDEKNLVWSQTERRRVPAHYKSRRIIGTDLMGFVKLSF